MVGFVLRGLYVIGAPVVTTKGSQPVAPVEEDEIAELIEDEEDYVLGEDLEIGPSHWRKIPDLDHALIAHRGDNGYFVPMRSISDDEPPAEQPVTGLNVRGW